MISPEVKKRLDSVIISPTASISEAVAQLDKAGTGALLLCATGRMLSGLLTDGDIRRAILRGIQFDKACETISTRNPVTANSSVTAQEALHLMNERDIDHLPLLDAAGTVVGFLLRRELASEKQLDLSAVIMAGGFGKRLLPLTEKVPKPMLPVGNRPLLERTIAQLRKAGINRVSLTTHYLTESIVQHFGNGRAFGVELDYITEEHPLGTAGGLKLIKNLRGPLLVINGDILTGLPFQEMLNYHLKLGAVMTLGVRKYEVTVPFGVVECEGPQVRRIREKPSLNWLINAGVYLVEPVVQKYIPSGRRFDMTDLLERLIQDGHYVASFPIIEYWLDVGRQADYQQAQEDVAIGRLAM